MTKRIASVTEQNGTELTTVSNTTRLDPPVPTGKLIDLGQDESTPASPQQTTIVVNNDSISNEAAALEEAIPQRGFKAPMALTLNGKIIPIPSGTEASAVSLDPNDPVVQNLSKFSANSAPRLAAFTFSSFALYPFLMFGCRGQEITAEMETWVNVTSTLISWLANVLLTTESCKRSIQLLMAQACHIRNLCKNKEYAEAAVEIMGVISGTLLAGISLLPFQFLLLEMGTPEQKKLFEIIGNGTAPYNGTQAIDQTLGKACSAIFSDTYWPVGSPLSALNFGLMFYGAAHSLPRKFLTHLKHLISDIRQAPHFSKSIWSTVTFLTQLFMILGFADPKNTSPSADSNSFFAYFKPTQMLTFALLWPLMMRVNNTFAKQENRQPKNWAYQVIINLFNANNLLGLIPLVALAIFQLEANPSSENKPISDASTAFPYTSFAPSNNQEGGSEFMQTVTVASLAVFASFIGSIIEGPLKELLWQPAYVMTAALKAVFRACFPKAAILQPDLTQEDARLTAARFLVRIPYDLTLGAVFFTTFAAVQNTIEDALKSGLSEFWTGYSSLIAILGGLTFNMPEIARIFFGALVKRSDKWLESLPLFNSMRKEQEVVAEYGEKLPLFRELVAKRAGGNLQLLPPTTLPATSIPGFLSMSTASCAESAGKNCAASLGTYLGAAFAALLLINFSYMGSRKLMGLNSYNPEQYNEPSDMAAWFCAIFMTSIMFQGMACFTNHMANKSDADTTAAGSTTDRFVTLETGTNTSSQPVAKAVTDGTDDPSAEVVAKGNEDGAEAKDSENGNTGTTSQQKATARGPVPVGPGTSQSAHSVTNQKNSSRQQKPGAAKHVRKYGFDL